MTWVAIFFALVCFFASLKLAWKVAKRIYQNEVNIYWLRRYNNFIQAVGALKDCEFKRELIAEVITIEILKKAKLSYVDIIRRRLTGGRDGDGQDPRHSRPSTTPHLRG